MVHVPYMYAIKGQFLSQLFHTHRSYIHVFYKADVFFKYSNNILLLANWHKVDIFIMPNHVPFNDKNAK